MRLAATALCLCVAAALALADDRGPPAVGEAMPQFTLFDADGRQVRLRDIKQPVVVLNFWAFWCDTWIAQLPQLRELATEQQTLGFRLLAVSVDGRWSDQLEEVCEEEGLAFSVLMDRRGRLSKQLRLRRIPTVIVLNRERRITYIHEAHPGNLAILQAIRQAASENSGTDYEIRRSP
jgi:peroxiredoxin